MIKYSLSKKLNDSELFKLFGKYAKYVSAGNFYYIMFNGKDLSSDNPKYLFKKVQDEYNNYKNIK